jgi:hypothetical protein
MLIAELAREAAAAVAVVVAGVFPAGGLDQAAPDPDPPVCALAASSGEPARCPPGARASGPASADTADTSSASRELDPSESATGPPGSSASCERGRDESAREPGGGGESSTPQASGEDDPADTASDNTAPASSARYPGDLINTDQWYLTLPTGEPGKPDTVEGEQLKTFSNEFFRLTPDREGIVFAANAGGVTTKNSDYPRSELREMNGGEKAAWSNTSGTHILDVCQAVTKVPEGKPEVVAAQIHDGSDDVMQIRLEDQTLMVQYDDGTKDVVLDEAYQLGTPYRLQIVAADRTVTVAYNGQQKAELPLSGSGWYWKLGAYVQSNPKHSDPRARGEVTVYSSQITHDDDREGAGASAAAGAGAGEYEDNDERAASGDTSKKVGSEQRAGVETSSSGDGAQDRPGGYDGPGDPSSR